ncbi:K02A2.6-like [Cordylochernes scorpioides]|uniref:K02A2.6-like n=1 Tax=Cordylochernes scorpioides TaxID=51811 RepID=A0ABY6LPW7_9ARAC|nr:K02A2.6-like [Cordylochernes scorpioides]
MSARLQIECKKSGDHGNAEGLSRLPLEVNEDVLVRDHFGPNRWIEGEITEKLGKCFYRILLRDKRVWRRHAGQIRKNWTLPCPDPETRLLHPPVEKMPHCASPLRGPQQQQNRGLRDRVGDIL